MNKVIRELLLNDRKITQNEYNILFEDKSTWYEILPNNEQDWSKSQIKINEFDLALNAIIKLQYGKNVLDLSFLHFPPFCFNKYDSIMNKKINFYGSTFYGKVGFCPGDNKYIKEINFENATFKEDIDFSKYELGNDISFKIVTFNKDVNFSKSTFSKNIDFGKSTFKGDVDFSQSNFIKDVSFKETIFVKKVSFNKVHFKEFFDASKMSFNKINLTGVYFKDLNLLELSGYNNNKVPLDANHFENKESARLIKAHFEKQNNITEANKYFRIEQEKYIDYLWDKNSPEHNKKATLTTLYLNKWVSDFSTDWIRALFFLVMFGYVAMLGYMGLDNGLGWLGDDKDKLIIHFKASKYVAYVALMAFAWFFIYLATYYEKEKWYLWGIGILLGLLAVFTNWGDVRILTNYIVQITNPINAFKDIDLYKGIEFYAVFVRISVAAIIYQLIVAFRQNTRRS